MYKATVTYTDYNGVEKTEDLYFHLNKAEILRLEATTPGGWGNYLMAVGEEKDPVKVLDTFEDIVRKSYGKKSEDGTRFIKSAEISEAFMQSEAYAEFVYSLVTDQNKIAQFMNAISIRKE